jgi:uncharacterized membrane protein YccC
VSIADFTGSLCKLQSELDNEREAHAKTKAELQRLSAECMANLDHWDNERQRLLAELEIVNAELRRLRENG